MKILLSAIFIFCNLGSVHAANKKSAAKPKAPETREDDSKIQELSQRLSEMMRDPKFSEITKILPPFLLAQEIAKQQKVTVLIPTNDALKRLPKQLQEDLKKPAYHHMQLFMNAMIIPQRVSPESIPRDKPVRIESKNAPPLAFNLWHDDIYLINQSQARPMRYQMQRPLPPPSKNGQKPQEDTSPVFYEVDSLPTLPMGPPLENR